MAGLDDRIVRVGIDFGGATEYYEGLQITAKGTLYGNDVLNPCEVRIDNLTKEHRDFILTETSPFRTVTRNIQVSLYAGRKSYGAALIYVGNITTSSVTQPPDIGIIMNCSTGYDRQGAIISVNSGPTAPLSSLAQTAADQTGTSLSFTAQDKQIANFSHTGSQQELVNKIAQAGNVDAYVENKTLVVKDAGAPIGQRNKIISLQTGMIGIPEITQNGIRVKFLLDNDTSIGDILTVESQLNPAINGDYVIYKLDFEIANRETPFYWIAEAAWLR